MSDRWIPVFAAVVGVIGGMGGAYIGGAVANEGQETRFERERAAALQDLRMNTYGTYLQAVDSIEAKIQVGADGQADYVRLKAAEARVSLLANAEVSQAARRLGDSLSRYNPDDQLEYLRTRGRFITLAQQEVTTGD
jgi:hypothetical protein